MCTEQKATRVHAGAAVGFELTCILFFLFFPFLPFPIFSPIDIYFLFKTALGLLVMGNVKRNGVEPVPRWHACRGKEEQEREGRREGGGMSIGNLKSKPGELCV